MNTPKGIRKYSPESVSANEELVKLNFAQRTKVIKEKLLSSFLKRMKKDHIRQRFFIPQHYSRPFVVAVLLLFLSKVHFFLIYIIHTYIHGIHIKNV